MLGICEPWSQAAFMHERCANVNSLDSRHGLGATIMRPALQPSKSDRRMLRNGAVLALLLMLLPLAWSQTCPTSSTPTTLYNLAGTSSGFTTGFLTYLGKNYSYAIIQSFVVSSPVASVNISAYVGYNTFGAEQSFMAYVSTAMGPGALGALVTSASASVPGPVGAFKTPTTFFTGLWAKHCDHRT